MEDLVRKLLMRLHRKFQFGLAIAGLYLCSSCQIGYLLNQSYYQLKMLNDREPIIEVMESADLTPEQKEKLALSQEARTFAETELGLKKSKNYTSFVNLDRSAVTYVVSAAPKWELKAHQWWFPIVGSVPYKGYFNENSAKQEEENLKAKGLDTFLRGVSAYSTLGYFNDPITSPMLKYKAHDLVNTIIHETVHVTMYFSSNADFNERIAVFLGNKGTELFYRAKEGVGSSTLARIRKENEDDKLFSVFISEELEKLQQWYQTFTVNASEKDDDIRLARIKEIQESFKTKLAPQLQSDSYQKFPELSLNNARLLVYRTYVADLGDFEILFGKVNGDFKRFIQVAKSFENSKDPVQALKKWNLEN